VAPSTTPRSGRARRVQQREIAERAGVSASTVSRVLNNIPGISPEVQRRVREAAAGLGYLHRASQPGAAIRRISLFTHLAPNARSLDVFHSGILSGIEAECRRQGINLSFTVIDRLGGVESELLQQLQTHEADGVLLLSVDDESFVRNLLAGGQRLVVLNSEYPDLAVDIVRPDNHAAALQATRLLLERGHRRILHYTALHRPTFHRRLSAYRQALQEAGIAYDPALVIDGGLDPERAYAELRTRLAAGPPNFTAVFSANDNSAMGIMRALQEAGLTVPADVSIVGCDDIPTAAYLSPPLTTVRIEREELGALAVRRLIDRATFPELTPVKIEMTIRLVERQSVAAPPRR
jgi:DNA-binding LacI/PurR family transcriptional regulator